MLKSLSIVNYALIENLEINFNEGFSVITGETGAGKSIIMGALSLILGKRADLSILKDKSSKCIIEGVFNIKNLSLKQFLIDNDLDYDDHTIIRREILPSGKSRAFINDTPVNLTILSSLGNKFVNIHSQNQTLKLVDASFQLNVLDDFINKPHFLEDYKKVYNKYITLSARLKKLIEENARAVKDEDYFKYQFEELDNASLNVDNVARFEARVKFLEHAEEIKLSLSGAESILNNDDNAVIDRLANLGRMIGNINSFLPAGKEILKRIDSVSIELKDILSEIESLNNADDFDPSELQLVSDKLSLVYSLLQKHHVNSVEELIVIKNEYEKKLLSISNLDEEIESVKSQLSIVEENLNTKAGVLHNERIKGSEKFSSAVTRILKQVGMKEAGFIVIIEQLDKYSSVGIDKVQFMFNANLGIEPGEISKVASGGELSRLMLAIKSLINKEQTLPTVVFDEIDSGVSGEIAGKVGAIIKNMAKKHQVISITHLPQIASKADYHYNVYKQAKNNSTITTISLLNDDGRVEELAKMLSNERVTETALNVARELMSD